MTFMTLKRTPLYRAHIDSGAKMVEFAGWDMPVHYGSVIKEHLAVRSTCGLFDVSHMGEIEISGTGAFNLVQRLTTNDVKKLDWGDSQYSIILRPDGTAIDDVIVYCHGPEKYIICTNASNTGNILSWIKDHPMRGSNVLDRSDETALIALQGPDSMEVLSRIVDIDLSVVDRFMFIRTEVNGADAIVSRTGYTGEDGYEIFLGNKDAEPLWDALLKAGRANGLIPAGLGARDTLRLDMGYPLYGSELTSETTPLDANLKWVVDLKGDDFIGRDALLKQVEAGPKKKLVGFTLTGRGIARPFHKIYSDYSMAEGSLIGEVTSGTQSPSLKLSIGMGYVDIEKSKRGSEIFIDIRGRAVPAIVTRMPFYKAKPVAKFKIDD